MKKIGIVVLLTIILTAVGWVMMNRISGNTSTINRAFRYIPSTASVVLFFDDFNASRKQLNQSEYGHHFQETRFYTKLNTFQDVVEEFETFYSNNESSSGEIISTHLISANDFDFLTVKKLTVPAADIKKRVSETSCGESHYMGETIYCVQTKPKLYAVMMNENWILSTTSFLVEDAVNHAKNDDGEIKKRFESVQLAKSSGNQLNVFINPSEADLLLPLVLRSPAPVANRLENFAEAMMVSVRFDADRVNLIGKTNRHTFLQPIQFSLRKDSLQSLMREQIKDGVFTDSTRSAIQREIAGFSVADKKNGKIYQSTMALGFGDMDIDSLVINMQQAQSITDTISSNAADTSETIIKDSVRQPRQEKPSEVVWSFQPEAQLSSWNHIIHNHQTNTNNLVIQNQNNEIILLNQNGAEKWRKQLDGRIKGTIIQIDYYRNGYLQMLFNTSEKIYLVDILGRDVRGFPIDLPQTATGELTLAQYENGKYRRFFIPASSGILGYKDDGTLLNEFNPNEKVGSITFPVQYSACSGNDRLAVTNFNNRLFILNRRGEVQSSISIEQPLKTPFVFDSDRRNCQLIALTEENEVIAVTVNGDEVEAKRNAEEALSVIRSRLTPKKTLSLNGQPLTIHYTNGELQAVLIP